MSGKPIGEADPNDFILAPDGTPDFGAITTEQAQSMRRQAGIIRLTVGQESDNGRFGLVHIENQRGDELARRFGSAANFVAYVAQNYNEIRQGEGGALFLVAKDTRANVLVVQLMPDMLGGEDYYRVSSGWLGRERSVEKRALLWSGHAESATVNPDMIPGSRPSTDFESGGKPPNVPGQSNASSGSLPPDAGNVKKGPELFQNPTGPRGSFSPASSVTTLFRKAIPDDAR